MEGMAATDAANGHPAATQRTITGDSGHCVGRATGHETAARPQQRTDEVLVQAQQDNEGAGDHAIMICHLLD
ncbi:hypothetical protein XaFJ1_GM001899 [Xanthomonas albilineans]|nr:hypothetical protein XaFJ1_GM001899 [Xanthomonas albilineans]